MNRKRLLSSITALMVMITVISGCSGNNKAANTSDGSGSSKGKEKVEITAWLTPQWKGVLDATEAGADYDSFLKIPRQQH